MSPNFKSYNEGSRAFHAGFAPDDNPYKMGGGRNLDRISWFDGYYDTRHDTKFGRMFEDAGLLTMEQERMKQWREASKVG